MMSLFRDRAATKLPNAPRLRCPGLLSPDAGPWWREHRPGEPSVSEQGPLASPALTGWHLGPTKGRARSLAPRLSPGPISHIHT